VNFPPNNSTIVHIYTKVPQVVFSFFDLKNFAKFSQGIGQLVEFTLYPKVFFFFNFVIFEDWADFS
jgi:hypothetical protein